MANELSEFRWLKLSQRLPKCKNLVSVFSKASVISSLQLLLILHCYYNFICVLCVLYYRRSLPDKSFNLILNISYVLSFVQRVSKTFFGGIRVFVQTFSL